MNFLSKTGVPRRNTTIQTVQHLLHIAPLVFTLTVAAQTAPPAPALLEPAAGASLIQPMTLRWGAVQDPDGPIGSYTWQIAASSTFGTVIASGFQNMLAEDMPARTYEYVSGLPNGTYFWRVKATQIVGGAVFAIDSPWSQVRSFTVTGLGDAPGTPTFTGPANNAAFHPFEFFDLRWTSVPGANYYILEADDEPSFSHPFTLTTDPIQFGTTFHAGWGNTLNVYYRVRGVSADNVRGLPSPVLSVRIINNAPVPPAPTPLSPVSGATVTLPAVFDWSDTPNPQIPGYDLDIDNEPSFDGAIGVVLIQNVSRSDYMLAEDQDIHLAPGTYFWRVRAIHGSVTGPWSSTATFNVAAPAPTPPGQKVFWIINEPGTVSGGNPTQARVTLNMPAGPGGALVKVASDLPHSEAPDSVFIPEGKTDAWASPITSVPVPGMTIGTIRAAYAGAWQQSSLGLQPSLWGLALSAQSAVGGDVLTGTLTLFNPAPPGGVEVTLVSDDINLAAPPAKVLIPAGDMGATFDLPTAPVSVPTRVVLDCGTAMDRYRAPGAWLTLLPAGGPPPELGLAALSLSSTRVTAGDSVPATVFLTAPAPAGGALVRLFGSMEGEVIVPQNVTVPAGSLSANFTINAPQVNAPRYVLIQASYGFSGAMHASLLEIKPGPPGPATVLALGAEPRFAIGGTSIRGTAGLVMPAPPGGGVVTLTSDNPSLAEVPPSITIPEGNSADSFTIVTRPVITATSVRINATAGGVTKSVFLNLGPDPNAPPALLSVTLSVSGAIGGNSIPGTIFLNANAPPGGASVTLATSSLTAAQVPPVVTVPAGQGWANFTVTTFPVSQNTQVTITGFYGNSTQTANLTVLAGSTPPPTPGTPSLLSPSNGATVAQPVNLDWSDASSAASYEIQVDDSSGFSTPLVRELTSTTSQTSVSGLASVAHWWRVRARNSAGTAGNWSSSRQFTPQSAPAPASLSAISVNPASVVGGNSSQGTVTLTSGAPSGGAVVTLSSSSADATVPASVTVAAGAQSATFTITTRTVSSPVSATLTASYNSVNRTAALSINPVSSGPLPAPNLISPSNDARFRRGQTVTFDWSDVAGAASYRIQIDDGSSFSAPQTVNQTVSDSRYSTSSLPARKLWWRVQAIDASGTEGAWSSVRRLEIRR